MAERVCLIHYHEIGLKGKNRIRFERRLIDNLKVSLKGYPVSEVARISGYLIAQIEDADMIDEIAAHIRKVPGVARVSLAYRTDRTEKEFCAAAHEALSGFGPFDSFKVQARRSNTDYPTDSMALNNIVGGYLCDRWPDKKVQMKKPDATVYVTVTQGSVYVYAKSEPGIGGLPVGSAGKVISLLSSGIDSPVATWKVLRRGAIAVPIHFSGRPQAADTSEYLVQDIIERLSPAGGIGRLYVVPFGDIQKEISLTVLPKLRIIMYRRLMFQCAMEVAKLENAKALVTGESLGQVASQTLENIMAVDEMATIPVFRPLIGSDKNEIIETAQRIDTFEISIEAAEDCCTLFMPRSPETHAKMSEVHEAWESIDHDGMLERMMDLIEYRSYECPSYKAPRHLRMPHAELLPAKGDYDK